MAFIKIYNTRQYEVTAVGNVAATSIPLGAAVKVDSIPTGLSMPSSYFKVSAAGVSDPVFGVVSAFEGTVISDTTPGKVTLKNAGLFPVLLSASVSKDDYIKVQTSDGKWAAIAAGETAEAQAIESGSAGDIVWVRPLKFKP